MLTAAEQHLVKTLPAEKGRDLLKQVRTQLIETARPALEALVQEITGAKPRSGFAAVRQGEDLILSGENFDAGKAHELGLVTKVVPRSALMQEARTAADRIAKASPTAILATRKAVAFNLRHGWDEMVRYEEEICAEIFAHPDAHEGHGSAGAGPVAVPALAPAGKSCPHCAGR